MFKYLHLERERPVSAFSMKKKTWTKNKFLKKKAGLGTHPQEVTRQKIKVQEHYFCDTTNTLIKLKTIDFFKRHYYCLPQISQWGFNFIVGLWFTKDKFNTCNQHLSICGTKWNENHSTRGEESCIMQSNVNKSIVDYTTLACTNATSIGNPIWLKGMQMNPKDVTYSLNPSYLHLGLSK